MPSNQSGQPIPDFMQRPLDAMLAAKWIRRYTMTDGKGLWIGWEEKGGHAAAWLKLWGQRLDVYRDDAAAVVLTPLTTGAGLSIAREAHDCHEFVERMRGAGLLEKQNLALTKLGADFFRTLAGLLTLLNLLGDSDALIGLFALANGWAPDHQTDLRPLPK